eukprot:jgi/Chlat1/1485/Chrsp12S02024
MTTFLPVFDYGDGSMPMETDEAERPQKAADGVQQSFNPSNQRNEAPPTSAAKEKQRREAAEAIVAAARRAYEAQERLLEADVTPAVLNECAKHITLDHYKDVVEERAIAHMCGYPLCGNALNKQPQRRGRYRISLKEKKVYDTSTDDQFCSPEHAIASDHFGRGLQNGAIPSVPVEQQMQAHSRVDTNLLVQAVQEHAQPQAHAQLDQHVGPAEAVDGYMPKHRPPRQRKSLTVTDAATGANKQSAGAETQPVNASNNSLKDTQVATESMQVDQSHDTNMSSKEEKPKRRVSWADGGPFEKEDGQGLPLPDQTWNGPKATVKERTVDSADSVEVAGDSQKDSSLSTAFSQLHVERPDDTANEQAVASQLQVYSPEDAKPAGVVLPAAVVAGVPTQQRLESAEQMAAALASMAEQAIADDDDQELPSTSYQQTGNNRLVAQHQAPKAERSEWYGPPPKGFSLQLSPFASLYMSLEEWVTVHTRRYIQGLPPELHPEDIGVEVEPSALEIRRTFSSWVARSLPVVVRDLRIATPVSVLESTLAKLLQTCHFTTALPAFNAQQWRLVTMLLLDVLSLHHIPFLQSTFQAPTAVAKVVAAAGFSSEEYNALHSAFERD